MSVNTILRLPPRVVFPLTPQTATSAKPVPTGGFRFLFAYPHTIEKRGCTTLEPKPGNVSTELQLRSEKEKSITCGCFIAEAKHQGDYPQSFGQYEGLKKTPLLFDILYIILCVILK